jgi:hypothetical protein
VYRWLSCLVVLVCTASLPAQGLLSHARSQVLGTPVTGIPGTAPSESFNIFPSHWGNWGGGDIRGLIVAVVIVPTSPFWVPACLLDDSLAKPGYFPARPYAPDCVAFIQPGEPLPHNDDLDHLDPAYLKPWSVRLALDDGNNFNGVNRLGGHLSVDTAWRVGVTTNWNFLHERLPGGHSDEAVLGDMNLTIRVGQNDWVQVHAGAGARLLSDRRTTQGGFNFLYSADFFPVDPLVISTQVDVGNLHDSLVIHARGTIGCQIGRFELFGGYDFLRIGSVNIQGPLAGLRLWF